MKNLLRELIFLRLVIKDSLMISFGMQDLKWGQISLQNKKHQAGVIINTVLPALMWVVASSIIIFWTLCCHSSLFAQCYLSSQKEMKCCKNIKWVWIQLDSYFKLQIYFCLLNNGVWLLLEKTSMCKLTSLLSSRKDRWQMAGETGQSPIELELAEYQVWVIRAGAGVRAQLHGLVWKLVNHRWIRTKDPDVNRAPHRRRWPQGKCWIGSWVSWASIR